jgi:hypothetical protein
MNGHEANKFANRGSRDDAVHAMKLIGLRDDLRYATRKLARAIDRSLSQQTIDDLKAQIQSIKQHIREEQEQGNS